MQSFQEPQGAEEEASEEDEEDDDEEEDDDITSAESNDSEEEEEVPGALSVKQGSKRGQLDWDNSTLTY